MVAKKPSAATVARRSAPKTTRPEAATRRAPELGRSAAQRIGKKLDAFPDRIDIRDWVYRPRLQPLPDQIVNCDQVPGVLDQGSEGACTGFALAACVNFALATRGLRRRVSLGARKRCEEAIAIRERLFDKDPSNVEWRRDLTHAHERMALVLISLKDTFAGELHRTRAREVSFGN